MCGRQQGIHALSQAFCSSWMRGGGVGAEGLLVFFSKSKSGCAASLPCNMRRTEGLFFLHNVVTEEWIKSAFQRGAYDVNTKVKF